MRPDRAAGAARVGDALARSTHDEDGGDRGPGAWRLRHRLRPGLGKLAVSSRSRSPVLGHARAGLRDGAARSIGMGDQFESPVPRTAPRSASGLSGTLRRRAQRLHRIAQPIHGGASEASRVEVFFRAGGPRLTHAGAGARAGGGNTWADSTDRLLWPRRRAKGHPEFCRGTSTGGQARSGEAPCRAVGRGQGSGVARACAPGSETRRVCGVARGSVRLRARPPVSPRATRARRSALSRVPPTIIHTRLSKRR